ncbi:EutN/CcmL family microcompartment protein [Rubrivirga sp. IMCC45206]|uniref:EutN/CcmL family microcompartment protein n=1 Tax=Rubrivirga sp. IMCC45206 TaxID=3391614 RepID=UPI00399001F7
MHLARVLSPVVATTKLAPLDGHRLLLVGRIGLDGHRLDRVEDVALDPGLDAGAGDVVLIAKEGAVVAGLLGPHRPPGAPATPANVIITAVVDDWTVEG